MKKAGLAHMINDKPTSVVVSGVGKDSEKCTTIQSVPGVLEDGTIIQYDAPRIPGSSVPALCGMQTLDEQNMGVLPWSNQLVKVPKGKEQDIIWPEGTTFIQCRRAKTGHMLLPKLLCAYFISPRLFFLNLRMVFLIVKSFLGMLRALFRL